MAQPNFSLEDAHRYFSKALFNQSWTILDMADRTPIHERDLIAMAYASLYHWTQVPDCTDRERNIAYWLLSRAYTICGNGSEALRAAQISLSYAESLAPFYQGYSHEAMARALALVGDAAATTHLQAAQSLLELVEEEEERNMLASDLDTIELGS